MLALKNAKLLLKDTIEYNKTLLLSDKIEGIIEETEIPEGCEVIDCDGGYISPGFIDLHIHGYLGKDVCDANVDSIRTIAGIIFSNNWGV